MHGRIAMLLTRLMMGYNHLKILQKLSGLHSKHVPTFVYHMILLERDCVHSLSLEFVHVLLVFETIEWDKLLLIEWYGRSESIGSSSLETFMYACSDQARTALSRSTHGRSQN